MNLSSEITSEMEAKSYDKLCVGGHRRLDFGGWGACRPASKSHDSAKEKGRGSGNRDSQMETGPLVSHRVLAEGVHQAEQVRSYLRSLCRNRNGHPIVRVDLKIDSADPGGPA